MIKDLKFLSDEELNVLFHDNPDKEVILWGVGFISDAIFNTLIDKGIKVSFYGDSNRSLKGQKKNGIEIISIDDMQWHGDAMVFISSYGYVPIFRMLKAHGVKNVYALRDVYKYPLSEMLADKKALEDISITRGNGRILLELYGNIGDVIIRIGIVQKFINEFGKDRIYLLFNSESHAELYKLITDNVICITPDDLQDRKQRQKLLIEFNKQGFEKSFILCDVRLIALHRIINTFNFIVSGTIYCDAVPEDEYLPGIDAEMVSKYFGWNDLASLTSWNKLAGRLVSKDTINGKYVVINLGASKKVRQYSPEAFGSVVEFLISNGYKVALVGSGEYDQQVADVLSGKYTHDLLDYTSELSLTESASLIAGADFFVGTDSAMSHVAYILGKPSVVIMGGGEYGSFKHRDGIVKYISVKDMSCFGCKWYCDRTDDYGRAECVYSISAEEIIAGIDELIEHS